MYPVLTLIFAASVADARLNFIVMDSFLGKLGAYRPVGLLARFDRDITKITERLGPLKRVIIFKLIPFPPLDWFEKKCVCPRNLKP